MQQSAWDHLEKKLDRFMERFTVWTCIFAILYTLGHLVYAFLRGAL